MDYNHNQSVVADLYQLPRVNGKFDKESKKLVRSGAKVLFSYVEQVNADSANNGKMYVIDHKATAERYEKQVENSEKRKANEQLSKVSAVDLLKALNQGSAKTAPQDNSMTDEQVEALKLEFKELSGDEPKQNWKPETLLKKVEELRASKANEKNEE